MPVGLEQLAVLQAKLAEADAQLEGSVSRAQVQFSIVHYSTVRLTLRIYREYTALQYKAVQYN